MIPDRDAAAPLPDAVIDFCRDAGLGGITDAPVLNGGMISLTRRLNLSDGSSLIVKQSTAAPPDLYAREAEGLRVLKDTGLRTPDVLAFSAEYLLLEDVGAQSDDIDWEALGRAIAHLHGHHHSRFGFERDNYLGLLPQINDWMDDGYEFFAQNRVLRYLREPLSQQTLTAEDRQRIERLMARLPQWIPPQPASLLHGDLWRENFLSDQSGVPTVIDPAVYYGWAEAELAMVQQCGGVPDAFYAAYNEVNPLAEGWRERLEILYLREHLSVIAHLGDVGIAHQRIRVLLDKFVG